MAVTGTAALSAEVKPVYDGEFYMQAQGLVMHDQLADLKTVMGGQRGNTYNFPIIENLQPNTAPLDELTDVSSQSMKANEIIVTLQEFGGALDISKFLTATSYADVLKQAAYANGYNLAESFDFIVRAVMGQGSRVYFPSTVTARTSLDGQGTAAHRMSASFLEKTAFRARANRMPTYEDGSLVCVMHPFTKYDLLQDTDVRTMASRQYPEILFNGEEVYWAGMRVVVTDNAKVFWGGGTAAASSYNTTLAAALAVGDSTMYTAGVTNAAVGQLVAILDATETGNTWTDTNEIVQLTRVGTQGAGGTGLDFFALDPGPGGDGVRYAHASGVTVRNHNSAYPIPFVGPNSITKVASDLTGPMGETVVTGPFDKLGRFLTFGWYAIAGWQRTRQGWLFRAEVGSSQS